MPSSIRNRAGRLILGWPGSVGGPARPVTPPDPDVGSPPIVHDPTDPGTYLIADSSRFTPDPNDPGTFLVDQDTTRGDSADTGTFLIGAVK